MSLTELLITLSIFSDLHAEARVATEGLWVVVYFNIC